ncbi:MAG: twin-arginine translocase TatA/TatE family subunit [Planctomycetes bacterium]|nr:twin-arginine translocase TatA/TatE family subunit [Planctomycetota bacterium]
MPTLAIFNLGAPELLIIAIVGLLLFGKRLPEVGRNLGKGIVEFKKGLAGVDEEVDRAATNSPATTPKQISPNDSASMSSNTETTKDKSRTDA